MRHLVPLFALFLLAAPAEGRPGAGPIAGPPGGGTPPEATPQEVAPGAVRLGVTERNLGASGACDDEGRHYDEVEINLRAGDWLRISARSDAFDTVLSITGPADLELENDDFIGGLLHSQIELQSQVAGTYRIRVRAFAPGVTGPYTLALIPLDPSTEPRLATDGQLDASLLPSGEGVVAPVWGSVWLEALAGERLRLRVTSPSFDTTAVLVAPSGALWFNDDAEDTGPDGTESTLDSTLQAVAPMAGFYHLMVFPYQGAGAGPFRIRASSRPPVLLEPGAERPATGYAGTTTDGRIVGLFAGISDYAGDDSDLYGCADDATLLAQAFRERGLMSASDQIVLTDAAVTRSGLLDGISELARRAGPNDLVVIFYSGHGDTTAAAPGDLIELDGTDERLSIYDGELTDNEVVARIDAIQANTIVLAIDACHAGGFERDFVTRPGRVGLFSSDPDVLSDTAEAVRAGGYLAYYLRQAVLGHADRAPNDGAMQAGELTDYLAEGFMRSWNDMNPPGDDAPDQVLQVDRGSIVHSDLLWLYPRRMDGMLAPVPDMALQSAPPVAQGGGGGGGSCR